MSLLDTLQKSLTPEMLSAVQDALGDDFDYDVVPRSRLNKVIKQRNEARKLLGQTVRDSEDPEGAGSEGGSGTGGFTQQDIDNAVQAERQKHLDEVAAMQKRYAVAEKLRESRFVDPGLVLSAGLIDLAKVVVDASGTITGGLEDQLKAVIESRPYLIESTGAPRGTGKDGGTGNFGSVTSREEFLKLSYEKQLEFKKANPEVFRGFMENTF